MKENPEIVFFGTDAFSICVLEELKSAGFLPKLVVTAPDSKVGRGLILTSSLVKKWAELNDIETIQPETLSNPSFISTLSAIPYTLFIVASYGKIIPQSVLDVSKHGVLNVHPSLLPKYRGATPIQSQILADDKNVGVTIMLMDAGVDHGPIVSSLPVSLSSWPIKSSELEVILGKEGGKALANVIPKWLEGSIQEYHQNHEEATFTKKIVKEDGLVDLSGDSRKNFLKFCAFDDSVGTYFLVPRKAVEVRVKIIEAILKDNIFTPIIVVPEGGRKMNYEDFLRGLS